MELRQIEQRITEIERRLNMHSPHARNRDLDRAPDEFWNALMVWRETKRISMRELSRRLGLPASVLFEYSGGKRPLTMKAANKIAAKLGFQNAELFMKSQSEIDYRKLAEDIIETHATNHPQTVAVFMSIFMKGPIEVFEYAAKIVELNKGEACIERSIECLMKAYWTLNMADRVRLAEYMPDAVFKRFPEIEYDSQNRLFVHAETR